MKFDEVFDAYMNTILEADDEFDFEDDDEGKEGKEEKDEKKEKKADIKLADVKKFIKDASEKDLEACQKEIEKALEGDDDDDDDDKDNDKDDKKDDDDDMSWD